MGARSAEAARLAYVCMYVCMYVHMYVCLYVSDIFNSFTVTGSIEIDGFIHSKTMKSLKWYCMYVCTVCMYVCMYVCM